jgi:hypothetical protein
MALFLPNNVEPLAPAADLNSWNDKTDGAHAEAEYFQKPIGIEKRNVGIKYHQL